MYTWCVVCHHPLLAFADVCHSSTRAACCLLRAGPTCSQCGVGSISTTQSAPACTPCEPGTFANTTGLSVCYECESGTTSTTPGAAQCTACSFGSFTSTTRSAACTPCAAGRYVAAAGATRCEVCSPGTFATGGAIFCQPCCACSARFSRTYHPSHPSLLRPLSLRLSLRLTTVLVRTLTDCSCLLSMFLLSVCVCCRALYVVCRVLLCSCRPLHTLIRARCLSGVLAFQQHFR